MAQEFTLQPSPIKQNTKSVSDAGVRGTWTPTVGGTATYTAQQGTYTRIGNLCFIHCTLWVASIGTGSQNTIWGLPFTSRTDTTSKHVVNVEVTGSLATNVVDIVGLITEDETPGRAILIKSMTAADNAHGEALIITSGTILNITGFYEVAFGE